VEERLSTKGIEAKQGCPFFGAAPRFLTQFLSPTNLSHPITILASNFGISNLFPNSFFFKQRKIFFATFTDTFDTKHSAPKGKDPGSSPDCLVGARCLC
jgi:hypothetical protein